MERQFTPEERILLKRIATEGNSAVPKIRTWPYILMLFIGLCCVIGFAQVVFNMGGGILVRIVY